MKYDSLDWYTATSGRTPGTAKANCTTKMARKRPACDLRPDQYKVPCKQTKSSSAINLDHRQSIPLRVYRSCDSKSKSVDKPPIPIIHRSSPQKLQYAPHQSLNKTTVRSAPRKTHPAANHSPMPLRIYRSDRDKSRSAVGQSSMPARIYKSNRDKSRIAAQQSSIPPYVDKSSPRKKSHPAANQFSMPVRVDRRPMPNKSFHRQLIPSRVHGPSNNEGHGDSNSWRNKFVVYCDLDGGNIHSSCRVDNLVI